MAYEPLDRSFRMVVTTAAGVQVAEPGTEPTSLDLETGSLFGFGSDWMTVEPHETSILAETGTGQLGRSAPMEDRSCWPGDSGDVALKNGCLVNLRCLLFLL